MRIVMLAFALLPAAAIAQERPAAPLSASARQCQNAQPQMAARSSPAKVRPLSQEPLADRYLGVVRIVDGCDRPIKVAEKVGGEQR